MLQQLINDTRQKFIEKLTGGYKGDCPCCGRYAQVYKRKLHHTTARQLILLYKLQGNLFEYVHASRLILAGTMGVGDFSKARYWGLIEPAPQTNDKKKSSGSWRLTLTGMRFVGGLVAIERYVNVFDDRVISRSGDLILISDCLNNGGFDYTKLMRG